MSRETVGDEVRSGDLTVEGNVSFAGGTDLSTALAGKAALSAWNVAVGIEWQSHGLANTSTTSTIAQDELRLWPSWCPAAQTVSAIRLRVVTAAPAGTLWRIGVYADSDGAPGALIADCGTVDPTSTGVKAAAGLSAVIPFGRFWIGLAMQGTSSTGGAYYAGAPQPGLFVGTSGNGSTYRPQAGVSGALPDPFVVGSGSGVLFPPMFSLYRSA